MKWVYVEDGPMSYYRLSSYGGIFHVHVKRYRGQLWDSNHNKWEIQLGWKDWSRDKLRFYQTPEGAMQAAEKLVIVVANKIVNRNRGGGICPKGIELKQIST